MTCNNLIKKKMVALLHDTPEKAWLMYVKKKHEEYAKERIGDVLGEEYLDYFKDVKAYDVISSTIDRWVVPSRMNIDRVIRLINPFDPNFFYEIDLGQISKEKIEDYWNKLKTCLSKVSGDRERYHAQYVLMELLWYKTVKVPLPADTRFPTHTVFDHVYATASMINIYNNDSKKFSGFIVGIDIPGIQSFISGGRRPGDWWIRSWLISATVWYLIKELVWNLGPDVLLSPSARYNPFYYATVAHRVQAVRECLDENLTSPEQPLMPATVTLLLPACSIELMRSELVEKGSLKEGEGVSDPSVIISRYFKERLKEAWKNVIEDIQTRLRSTADNLIKTLEKVRVCTGTCTDVASADDLIERMIEIIKHAERAPFDVKTVVINLEEAFEEFVKEFRRIEGKMRAELEQLISSEGLAVGKDVFPYSKDLSDVMSDLEKKLFFHWLVTKKYPEEFRKAKAVRLDPLLLDGWTLEVTKARYESCKDKSAPMCTCGRPAAVHNPSEASSPLLRSHEALCPYCLILRLLQYYTDALTSIVEADHVKAPKVVMSTLAALPELVKWLSESGGAVEIMDENGNNVGLPKDQLLESLTRSLKEYSSFDFYQNKYSRFSLEEVLEELQKNETVERLIRDDSKNLYIRVLVRKDRDSSKLLSLNKYIAMVKADADNMGNLKGGRLGYDAEAYFETIYRQAGPRRGVGQEEKLYKLAGSLVRSVIERLHEIYPKEVYGENDSSLPTVLVTPTYLFQLSYSLMTEALVDKEIVEKNYGLLVFAGGDDLLALVPARSVSRGSGRAEPLGGLEEFLSRELLEIVKEFYFSPALWVWWLTRLNHWGLLRSPVGFRYTDNFFAPALLAYGRSYGIAIRHYRDPLAKVFEDASELEESAKNVSKKKDGVGVSYGRLGARGVALSNSLGVEDKGDLKEPASLGPIIAKLSSFHRRGLSNNFYYDIVRELQKYFGHDAKHEWAAAKGLTTPIIILLKYIISRNVADEEKYSQNLKKEVEEVLEFLKLTNEYIFDVLEFGFAWHKAVR
ncbi:type III-B CRISPR-associated protein Cas10/Cmr2 [Ignicoccus hospitalis]|uniref:CRISPR-associated protein Cmr2 N-terminal domain-containing protein n=1 Tax=Ignicoccus hospitalis (strain KIN4/I / DSM 18386 / JCM 14125) TaxID=453591 RepID=A8A9A9_IGNH4|nr:type III-B CRISPR-associated protein Cas10/Cmr2 [Ignicoccus hospitalis]ABU81511.1 hypothetical protein Igni_0328 [Ignicoccus hospitalis KIN4/I]HIH90446.1 type III-B CRISPR-associated protein Cas10/Cmr2 [Desulfurococcaceae archaeon]